MNKSMKAETESGLRNAGCERRSFSMMNLPYMKEEMVSMKLGGSCGVSSAASTRGTFAEAWIPRKIDIKGCVEDWSQRETPGLTDDQVMEHPGTLEIVLPQGTRDVFDWSDSVSNKENWTTKTMISLWFLNKDLRPILVAQGPRGSFNNKGSWNLFCPFLQWSQVVFSRVVRFVCAGMLRSAHGTAEVVASSGIVMPMLA